jgi:hypothetical protein
MVDASAIVPSMNFSDQSEAQRGAPVVPAPEAPPNQPVEWSLDNRIYRTLARSCIQEHKERTARTKTATSVYVTVISAAFFIAIMAIAYLSAR